VRAKDALTPLPGAQAADSWRLLEAVRYEKTGEPIAWKQVYIDARYDSVASEVGKRTVPVYSLVEERYGIKTEKVLQEIGAVAIPEEAARALKVRPGSLGLSLIRHYFGPEERVFEVTMSIYPAERFRYSVELKLEYGR
jgi:DNA-binding GntR family transcriptional regulator